VDAGIDYFIVSLPRVAYDRAPLRQFAREVIPLFACHPARRRMSGRLRRRGSGPSEGPRTAGVSLRPGGKSRAVQRGGREGLAPTREWNE
jgi:hypothetical protein